MATPAVRRSPGGSGRDGGGRCSCSAWSAACSVGSSSAEPCSPGARSPRRTACSQPVQPGDVHLRIFGGDLAATIAATARRRRRSGPPGSASDGSTAATVCSTPGSPPRSTRRRLVRAGRDRRPAARPGRPDRGDGDRGDRRPGRARPGDRLELVDAQRRGGVPVRHGLRRTRRSPVELTVIGVMRVPPGLLDGTPVIATPAFAAEHRDLFAGYDVRRPAAGGSTADGFIGEVQQLAASSTRSADDDFAAVAADRPPRRTERLRHASRVLFAALVAAVLLAGARRHRRSRPGVGAATRRRRRRRSRWSPPSACPRRRPGAGADAAGVPACARSPACVAAAVGASRSWVAARRQPVAQSSPTPAGGSTPSRCSAVALLVAVGDRLTAAAFTAWRAGRGPDRENGRSAAAGCGTCPAAAWLAARRRRVRALARRATAGTCRCGCRWSAACSASPALVGSVVFTASLDRLVESPARCGLERRLRDRRRRRRARRPSCSPMRGSASVADARPAPRHRSRGAPSTCYAVRAIAGDRRMGRCSRVDAPDGARRGDARVGRLARQLGRRVGDERDGRRPAPRSGSSASASGRSSSLEALGSSALFTRRRTRRGGDDRHRSARRSSPVDAGLGPRRVIADYPSTS